MDIKVGDWVMVTHNKRVFQVDEIRYLEDIFGNIKTQIAVKDRWFGRSWIDLYAVNAIRSERPLPPPPKEAPDETP